VNGKGYAYTRAVLSNLFDKRNRLLLALLAVDALFFFLHFCYVLFKIPNNKLLFIEADVSFGEFFQYCKYLILLTLLFITAWQKKTWLYGSWALLFCYLLADDSLRIHEQFGLFLSQFLHFHPALALRATDFGELLSLALTAGTILVLIALAHYYSDKATRRLSYVIVPTLALLIFCGVILDMAHILFAANRYTDRIFGFLEDGGEMLTLSLLVGRVWGWSLVLREVTESRSTLLPNS
jgi:hypothetical protein